MSRSNIRIKKFFREIKNLSSDFSDDIQGIDFPLHPQLYALARLERLAVNEGRLEEFEKVNAIVSAYFQTAGEASDELSKAIKYSYLAELSFDGGLGPEAWDALPVKLQNAYKQILDSKDD